jgi:hypothetical protein
VYNVADGTLLLQYRMSAGPLRIDFEVKQEPFATLYTRPPDDGLQIGPKRVECVNTIK